MNLRHLRFLIVLFLLTPILIGSAIAQGGTTLIKPTQDFDVNGQGDNEQWSLASWVSIPQRSEEGAQYVTRVKILYSRTGIYFLFNCEDQQIVSSFDEDFADLWKEDVVEVFFWTDENYPFYFEYELSPNNYELPIFVPNVDGDFLGWRPWHYDGDRKTRHMTSVQRDDQDVISWTAEFFIPFALLKPMANVPPKPGTKWRANMYRIDYDNGVSTWAWQPIRTNFHDFERFGTFVFE